MVSEGIPNPWPECFPYFHNRGLMTDPALMLHPEHRRLPITRDQSAQLAALDARAAQAQNELTVALRMVLGQHELAGNWRVVQLDSDAIVLAPTED